MQDMGDCVFAHDAPESVVVAEINFLEDIFGIGDALEVREVARISEAIEIDEPFDLRLADNVMDEIRPDKARTAGDDE